MSSYSYMVIPTSTDAPFNTDKGKTLSTFINYFLCQGQQKADILGYSPLPKNLVLAGFDQVKRIPGAVALAVDRDLQQPGARHPQLRARSPTPAPSRARPAAARPRPPTAPAPQQGGKGGGTGAGGDPTAGATDGRHHGRHRRDRAPAAPSTRWAGPRPRRRPTRSPGDGCVDPAAVDASGAQAVAAAPGTVVQLTGGRAGQDQAAAWIGASRSS